MPPPARYFATLPRGLEALAAEELAERVSLVGGEAGAGGCEVGAGWLRFASACEPRALLELRAVEQVYAELGLLRGLATSAAGPAQARAWAAELDWPAAAALRGRCVGGSGPPGFRATVERRGEHAFRSPDLERALGAGLRAQLPWPVQLRGYSARVHGLLAQDSLLLGLALHAGDLSQARRERLGPTALKPCVAAAMLRLARIEPGQVVLDPLCGRGAIPAELAAGWPGARLLAGERDAAALAVVRAAGLPCARWDARRLPLGDASVDAVVSDLPFGRRVGSHRANKRLYPALLSELRRVLRPGGVAVLLSGEVRLLERSLPAGLEIESRRRVDLGGLTPTLDRLVRRAP